MNKIEEEKKRAEEELYMALNPAKNKPLAQSANTGYNKKNGGSYTGSTTVIRAEKSPLETIPKSRMEAFLVLWAR